jgi:3-oxoacyl-[acyl-carrier-protein] synthase II
MNQMDGALAITGWGIISPIGIGRDNFTRAFWEGDSGSKLLPVEQGGAALEHACYVADFDTAKFLGPRGTRSMDRTTGMAVAGVGMALEHSGIDTAREASRVGVVLGTSTGSIKSIVDFTRETLVQERPYLVNPALFPNTVMNCAAGQSAIWHKLKGVNATISGGHLSALLALKYSSLTIRRGYSDVLLTGAVEEFCEPAAWAYRHTRSEATRNQRPLGEGCAVCVVEHPLAARARHRTIKAEILVCEVGVFPGVNGDAVLNQADGLACCIGKALARASLRPGDVVAVSTCMRGITELDRAEEAGINMAFDGNPPARQFSVSELVGDCVSAAGMFQLSALLAYFDRRGEDGCVAVMTCMGSDGHVGCALVRSVKQ